MQHGADRSTVRRTDRLFHRHRGVIVWFWVVLAGATPIAQQGGGPATESVATLSNRDLNGTMAVNEQTVTRRSQTNDRDQVVIDTYTPSMEGGRLSLSRRVRRATTATSTGTQTVEELEERNPVAPGESLRVVRRSVTTVRRGETGGYVSERQVFALDVNGRFVPVLTQAERGSGNDREIQR